MSILMDVGKCRLSTSGLPSCVLISCGSFNPITNFHLRLFEDARDSIMAAGDWHVLGGFVSPVHQDYGKVGLAPFSDRYSMSRLAVQDSDWVSISGWEGAQATWSRTADSLTAHHDMLVQSGFPSQVLLLCGADMLDAFRNEIIWPPSQVDRILRDHGLAVMEREGYDLDLLIRSNPILSRSQHNIRRIPRVVVNDVSSSLVRKLLVENRSIKYLVPNQVIDYIRTRRLFQPAT